MLLPLLALNLPTYQHPTTMGPWQPMKGSPLAFARMGDAAMHNFKNTEGHTGLNFEYEGFGTNRCEIEIRTPNVFRIEFARFHYPTYRKDPPITKLTVVSNGRSAAIFAADSHPKVMPLSSFRFNEGRSIQDWVLGFPRFVFGSVRGEGSIASLVGGALGDRMGYNVVFQTRNVVNNGVKGRQVRTSIDRLPPRIKRDGPLHIELICDATYGIPVQMEMSAHAPGHSPFKMTWYAAWRGHSFEDKEFRVPDSAAKG